MSSLRQIAKRLDVSHATVSAALRGLPGVRPSTRERVLRIAEQTGYRINPLASALFGDLRRAKSGVFRGLLALVRTTGVPEDEASRVREGMERRARELGFMLQESSLSPAPADLDKLHDVLVARGVQGVTLLAPRSSGIEWHRLNHAPLHLVCAGFSLEGMDSVRPDFAAAIELARGRLSHFGLKRPLLALRIDTPVCRQRAWDAAFCAMPDPYHATETSFRPPEPIRFSPTDAAPLLRRLRDGGHDCVLFDTPPPADWLPFLRARLGGDDCVICLNLHPPYEPFSGVDLGWEEIGARCVERISAKLLRTSMQRSDDSPVAMLCHPTCIDAKKTNECVA